MAKLATMPYHILILKQERESCIPFLSLRKDVISAYNFIPLGLLSLCKLIPGRPMMIGWAMKFPDRLRSSTELRICGTSSV